MCYWKEDLFIVISSICSHLDRERGLSSNINSEVQVRIGYEDTNWKNEKKRRKKMNVRVKLSLGLPQKLKKKNDFH
jgi:aspartyl aminopeptidase